MLQPGQKKRSSNTVAKYYTSLVFTAATYASLDALYGPSAILRSSAACKTSHSCN
jgi:hypothetical protein